MLDIFVLEDNKERIKWFKTAFSGANLKCVTTVKQAKKELSKQDYYMIFLDHDLGGEIFVDASREDTGTALVKHIVEKGIQKNATIIIHSQNPPAAEGMCSLLKANGYLAKQIPFTSLYSSIITYKKEQ